MGLPLIWIPGYGYRLPTQATMRGHRQLTLGLTKDRDQDKTKAANRSATNGPIVEIFTDGACSGNPGRGGWGVLLRYKEIEKELFGGEADTTNNRMEMMAAIKGLAALKQPCFVVIHTDSRYLQNGIITWIHSWKKKGWVTKTKKPVKNIDLWQQLDELVSIHQVEWVWVKGHSGHLENERADSLAQRGKYSKL